MAFAKLELGELDEAMRYAQSVATSPLPGDRQHADLIGRVDIVGQILLAMGRHEEARVELEAALRRMEAHFGDDHRFLAEVLGALGRARHALRDREGAARALRRALEIHDATPHANPRSRAHTELALAQLLPDPKAARALAEAALQHYDAAGNTRPADRAAAVAFLAR
jgi:tetratricopeptide (TPR) repeat protein